MHSETPQSASLHPDDTPPEVSIITPAWKAGDTIARAVGCALSQTGVRVEVIVADDASPDHTARAVQAMQSDPRVRLLRLPVNGGPSAARNAALDAARGEWVAVLDADDTMPANRIAALLRTARAEALDIVCDNMWILSADGRRAPFFEEEPRDDAEHLTLAAYALRNRMFGRRKGDGYLKPMFRTAFLNRHGLRYRASLRVGEDFLLVAEAMALGARYARLRQPLYEYHTHAGSISHRMRVETLDEMISADRVFLSTYVDILESADRAAMHRHLQSLLDARAFMTMVDAMKNRDIRHLLGSAARRPAAIRHFSMPLRARIARLAGAR